MATIESLEAELTSHTEGNLGTMILGDMNVHENMWLRFSNGTSMENRKPRIAGSFLRVWDRATCAQANTG